jgi:hypothetical protein
MCRSNVIIYQNETKFEIYCNDKRESHHITAVLKQYINIIRFNYKKSLMQIIVCLFMGGHEIWIKRIFDFRTSLPINEILYIQYINGKRKKSHRKKSHKKSKKIHIFHCFYWFCFVVFIRDMCIAYALVLFGCISPDMCIAYTLVVSSLIVCIYKLFKVFTVY